MKNIFKVALSLMLALAVLLVPMAVTAAVGDPVATPAWENCIYSGDTVTVGAGKTIYYEIGTNNTAGTYGFIVTGTGDFDVAVCTEGTTDTYAAGTPISAKNGKVETTITSYESTSGYACFSITNNTSKEASYTCTVALPEGTQGNPKAVTLSLGGNATVNVPAGGQYYVAVTLPEKEKEYMFTITGKTGFGYSSGWGMPIWDTNGTFSSTIASYYGTANFSITNNTRKAQTYTLSIANLPLGAQSNPDTLTVNKTITKELTGEYWYTWTAPSDGTLNLTMDNKLCKDGWTYNFQNQTTDTVIQRSVAWDESDKNAYNLAVSEGDIVLLGVSVPTGDDAYTFASGTVVFSTAFDSVNDDEADKPTEPDVPVDPSVPDEPLVPDEPDAPSDFLAGGDNYSISVNALEIGSDTYAVDSAYTYTVFAFTPTKTGKYTISSTDSTIGIVSYTDMWVQNVPTTDNVASASVEWECTAVGQGIYLAVLAETSTANITVSMETLEVKEVLAWTVYKNTAKLEPFTFDGDIDTIEYLDITDDIADVAILGDDGFYHLNDANGPILYVDLDDTVFMNLVDAMGFGQLKYVISENGEAVVKIDYNSAFAEYLAVADADEGIYPLTADLIEIYKNVGIYQNWYGKDGWVGGELDDAWMFACCYIAEAVDAPSGDGEDADTIVTDDNDTDFDVDDDTVTDNKADADVNTGNVSDSDAQSTENDASANSGDGVNTDDAANSDTDGAAKGESPKTGDFTSPFVAIIMLAVFALTGLTALVNKA